MNFSENFSRNYVTTKFISLFKHHYVNKKSDRLKIAVVGGSTDEPELLAIKQAGFEFEVTSFGIELSDYILDLNVGFLDSIDKFKEFDLVLCSQVLEHVWNHHIVFQTLVNLAKPGGFIWLACPAANRPHGSPDFFSAGFTDSYLALNLANYSCEILECGMFGSKRTYYSNLIFDKWLTISEHNFPLKSIFLPKVYFAKSFNIRRFLRAIQISLISPITEKDTRFATESWCLAKSI